MEDVAGQLERLYTRIEFNDEFELDVVAPKTWLAEWQARFELVSRLQGRANFELIELRLGPEDDVLDPGRRLAETVVRGVGHRATLVHVIDDGGDRGRWQPFFRRLNEVRNALIREFRGNLILLIAPRLVSEFAGEAPDVWSVAAVMVAGTQTEEELQLAMLDYIPALLRLTREDRESAEQRARRVGERWVAALARSSAAARARQLIELMMSDGDPELARANVATALGSFSMQLNSGWIGRNPYTDSPTFQVLTAPANRSPKFWSHELLPERLHELNYLLDLCQESADADFRLVTLTNIHVSDPRLATVRRCFDLCIVSDPLRRWSVIPGTAHEAPLVARGGAPVVTFEIEGRRAGSVQFEDWSHGSGLLGHDTQLWLPIVDPHDLGSAALYRPH